MVTAFSNQHNPLSNVHFQSRNPFSNCQSFHKPKIQLKQNWEGGKHGNRKARKWERKMNNLARLSLISSLYAVAHQPYILVIFSCVLNLWCDLHIYKAHLFSPDTCHPYIFPFFQNVFSLV